MTRQLPVVFLPEGDEVEDLLGFFALAQVGVGVTESSAFGVVGYKDQDTGLAPAASRHVMALDDRVFAIVGDGVKIEIEVATCEEVLARDLGVPGGQQLGCLGAVDAVRVFGKMSFSWE